MTILESFSIMDAFAGIDKIHNFTIKAYSQLTIHHPLVKRKAAARFIRGGEKARFSATLRAGFATAHTAPYRKIGFTLAEVLITLGIIGVVAAMTLPALINQTQGKELETGLQTAYSLLQQGIMRMSVDRGNSVTSNDFVSVSFYDEYKKYFNKIKDCGFENPDTTLCMSRGGNEQGVYADLSYKTFNGQNNVYTLILDDGQFILSNGMLIMIENNYIVGLDRLYISVDVNGKKKKPNRWGHDLFTFQLMQNGKLLPMGAEGTNYDESYCSLTSNDSANGVGCTYKALTDKNYFKNLPK